jgi:hypothetical protein
MQAGIHKPIIILGAARSGTGLLIGSLARHPDLAWIEEPNFVWKSYNADVGHDMLPPTRATDRVKRHIHARFDAMRKAQGRARIVEKTPQSTLRLPFVLEVFPDAKLVHVIRDGRQVVASARRKYMGSTEKITRRREGPAPSGGNLGNLRAVAQVMRQKWDDGLPLRDLLHYGPKVWNMSLGMMGLKKAFAWGPEFPGMRRMMKTHPLVDVCAMQWQLSVEGVLNTLAARPDVDCLTLRFERLVEETEEVTREIFDFAELPRPDALRPLPANRFDAGIDLFERELDAHDKRIVYDRIGETLRRLGYRHAPGPDAACL